MAIRTVGAGLRQFSGTCSPGSSALPIRASRGTEACCNTASPSRGVALRILAWRARRRPSQSVAETNTPSQSASRSQLRSSSAVGIKRSPITVIARSPLGSIRLIPRRLGWSRQATTGSTPNSLRRCSLRWPIASRPSAVKNRTLRPVRRASWTAMTAPAPAGSSRSREARPILPGLGSASTSKKVTHS